MIDSEDFDPAIWDAFLIEIIRGDADGITDWLTEHATSDRSVFMLLQALPRFAAILIRRVTGVDHPLDDDEGWILERVGGGPSTTGAERVAQLVSAALNEDDPAITGHAIAIMEYDPDDITRIVASLIAICHDAFDALKT